MLPWIENFETTSDSTYIDSSSIYFNRSANSGDWKFDTDTGKFGRLRTFAGVDFAKGGHRALTLDRSTAIPAELAQNYVTLSLDLSASIAANDLELSFWFMNHADEADSGDQAWIRGSDTSKWVGIYDFRNATTTSGIYYHSGYLDIDSTLNAQTPPQTVSSNFQLKFGQVDNYPASSIFGTDGVTIDNVRIDGSFNIPNPDVSVQNISINGANLCSGSTAISVTALNVGTVPIDSVILEWEVNGIKQTTIKNNALSLNWRDSVKINLGNYNFLDGINYDIKAWVVKRDTFNKDFQTFNDTTFLTGIKTGLSGNYTIDSSLTGTNNYLSITDAVKDLINYGICGPVNFQLSSGTYNESFSIPKIAGTSNKDTIKFTGFGMNQTIIKTEQPTGTMRIIGCNYLTFKNLQIRNLKGYHAVTIGEYAHDITFDSCRIMLDSILSFNASCIESRSYLSSNPASLTSAVNDFTVTNCEFMHGKFGIHLQSFISTPGPNSQALVKILNCNFHNNNAINIGAYYGIVIENCQVLNNLDSSQNAIQIGAALNVLIKQNTIITGENGISLQNVSDVKILGNEVTANEIPLSSWSSTANKISLYSIENNLLNSIGGKSTAANLLDVYGLEFIHNSCFGQTGVVVNSEKVSFINNIISGVGHVISSPFVFFGHNMSVSDWDSINYNLYYSVDQLDLFNFNGVKYKDVSTLVTSLPTLAQPGSLEGNPYFISDLDLHTRSTQAIDNGITFPGITEDVDGDPRPMGAGVDIGADEFNAVTKDLMMVSILRNEYNGCGDSLEKVRVVVKNIGLDTLRNIPLFCEVSGDTIAILNGTLSGPLSSYNTDTITLSSGINTYWGGSYDLKAYHGLSADTNNFEDTIYNSFKVKKRPVLSTVDQLICRNSSTQLSASSSLPIVKAWYASDTGNTKVLGYNTSTVFVNSKKDTIFWVQESEYGSNAVRFTEIIKDTNAAFELQNLGYEDVNVNGWKIILSDDFHDISKKNGIIKTLTGVLKPGDLIHYFETFTPSWGGPINWLSNDSPNNRGWVLLVDNNDVPVDFVVWGWREDKIEKMEVDLGSKKVRISNLDWTGDGLAVDEHYERLAKDKNKLSDWAPTTAAVIGVTNVNYSLPIKDIGNYGCMDPRVPLTVSTVPKPQSSFSYVIDDSTVIFTNNTVRNPLHAPYSFIWKFGDGSSDFTEEPNHTYLDTGTYAVKLISRNRCEDDTSIVEVIIKNPYTGIGDQENRYLSIYPNPVIDFLTIKCARAIEIKDIKIFDVTGKIVYSQTVSGNNIDDPPITLDLSTLIRGYYLLKVTDETNIDFTAKISKK